MLRREFLHHLFMASTFSVLPVLSSKVFAAPTGNNCKTLIIFLRGAYDGLNCLIPYSDSFYYESRPTIAIAKPDTTNDKSSIMLNADFSLHPALKESIYPLFLNKEVVFIPAAGQVDNSRSHFHAQDMMEYGYADNGGNYQSGFLNRFLDTLNAKSVKPSATSYTGNLPIILKGSVMVPNISLAGDIKPHISDKKLQLYSQMYAGNSLGGLIQEGFDTRKNVSDELQAEMKAANRGATSPKGFAEQTHKIATLMKSETGINIGFIDVGGWDTHVNQGGSEGQYANNLKQLGEGLLEFRNSMGTQWQNTQVMIISEFGRTARENGNKGTDHGHGNVMWVLGGSINGGRIGGHWESMQNHLHENRDINVYNDYRNILANIWRQTYQFSNNELAIIFPGYDRQQFNIS